MSADAPASPSIFLALGRTVPKPLDDLRDAIALKFGSPAFAMTQEYHHQNNLERRLEAAVLFEYHIERALQEQNAFLAAELANAYLCAYLSAVKSLLDASAVAIDKTFGLNLAPRNQDFGKGKFWHEFGLVEPVACARYAPLRGTFQECIKWRDSAIHRTAPFVIVHHPGPPSSMMRANQQVRMLDVLDADLGTLVGLGVAASWISPLDLPRKWWPTCLELVSLTCEDIQAKCV